MVNDRLHIICGNCGQDLKESGMAKWEYSPADIDDDGEEISPAMVYIECENCSTLHSLNKYMPNRKNKKSWQNTAETYYKGLSNIEKFVKTEICGPCIDSEIENCNECNYKIILDYIREAEKEVENGGENE